MKWHPRELNKIVGAGMVLRAGKLLLQLLTLAVLARLLSLEEFGSYAFLIVLVQVLSIPAQFGLPQLIVRETVTLSAANDTDGLRQLGQWANRNALIASAIGIPVGVIVLLAGFGPPLSVAEVALGLVLVPLLALGNLRSSQLRALGRGVFSQFAELFVSPAVFLALILVTMLADPSAQISVAAVLGMRAIGAVAALLVAHTSLMRALPRNADTRANAAQPPRDTSRLSSDRRKATIVLGISAGIYALNGNLDILMLGNFWGEEETALYRIAFVTAGAVTILIQSLNAATGPMIAHGLSQSQSARVESLIASLLRKLQLLLIPILLFMVLAGRWAISVAFGVAFEPAYETMLILLLSVCLNIWFGPAGLLLNMSGHERPVLRASLLSLAVNLLLNIVLVPRYGAAGAASATVLATLLWNAQLWLLARRLTGVNTLRWLTFWR